MHCHTFGRTGTHLASIKVIITSPKVLGCEIKQEKMNSRNILCACAFWGLLQVISGAPLGIEKDVSFFFFFSVFFLTLGSIVINGVVHNH